MEENKTMEMPENSEEASVNVSPLLAEFAEEPITETTETAQVESPIEAPVVEETPVPEEPAIESPVEPEKPTPVIESPVVNEPSEEAYVAAPTVSETPVEPEVTEEPVTNEEVSQPEEAPAFEEPIAAPSETPATETQETTVEPAQPAETALVVDESTIVEKPQEVAEEKPKEPSKVAQIVGTTVVLLITAGLAYLIIRNFLAL